MKTFRQKFTQTSAFSAIIIIIIMTLVGIWALLDRPFWAIMCALAFMILFLIRAISSCCYLTVTDNKFALINPYIRYYREFLFEDITHADICFGGTYAYNYLQIRTHGGKKFRKEIDLVRQKDYNEILRIFEAHGIEVKKFWRESIE